MNNRLLTVIILEFIWSPLPHFTRCLFFLILPFAHFFSCLSKNILNDFFLSRKETSLAEKERLIREQL